MEIERLDQLIRELTELRHTMGVSPLVEPEVKAGEWLASILEASPEVISLYDLDGRLTYLSRTLVNAGPEKYVGRRPEEFLPPREAQVFVEAFKLLLETGLTQKFEVEATNGMVFETRLAPVRLDGKIQRVLSLGTDVTKRKKTEAALNARDQQLRLAAQSSGIGFWRWDVTRSTLELGESAATMLGLTGPVTVPLHVLADRVHPSDRDRVVAEVVANLTDRVFKDVEARLVLPNGKTVWVLAKGQVSASKDAKVIEVIGGLLDVTKTRTTESAVQHARRLESIGQLAAEVAHDFNNLLMVIVNNLLAVHGNPGHPSRDQLLEEAMVASQRGAELTKQLLSFGKRRAVYDTTLELNPVVEETLKLFRRVISNEIEVDFTGGPELPKFLGDRGELEQVVMNLCVNARDAMPNGGRLSLRTEVVKLDAGALEAYPWAKPGRYLLLWVSDTGLGITPELLEQVFDPFFTTKPQGTGLGLATVYGLVKHHGGLVSVESAVGKGTTFKVFLPVSE
ncbi:MAG: ATP-binding protein [Myxococcaceae bacterium]